MLATIFSRRIFSAAVLILGATSVPLMASAQAPPPREDLGMTTEHRPTSKPSELYVIPELGAEFGSISRAVYYGYSTAVTGKFFSGTATSLALGGRFGDVNLGVRWQGTITGDESNNAFFNKIYAEIGGNIRWSHFLVNIYFDFGYAGLSASNVAYLNGLGGKIGATFDYFPVSWFSIGPTASFDAQGFAPPAGLSASWINALSTTLGGRIGFHI